MQLLSSIVESAVSWLSAAEAMPDAKGYVHLLPPLHHAPIPIQCFVVIDFDNTLLRGQLDSARVAQSLSRYRECIQALHASTNSSSATTTTSTSVPWVTALAEASNAIANELFHDPSFLLTLLQKLEEKGHHVRVASFSCKSTDIKVQPWLHKPSLSQDITPKAHSLMAVPPASAAGHSSPLEGPIPERVMEEMISPTISEFGPGGLQHSDSSVMDRPPHLHSAWGTEIDGLPHLEAPDLFKPNELPDTSLRHSSALEESGSRRISNSHDEDRDSSTGPPVIRNAVSYATELRERKEAAVASGSAPVRLHEEASVDRYAVHDILDLLDALCPSRSCLSEGCHVLGWRGDNKNDHINVLWAHYISELRAHYADSLPHEELGKPVIILIDDDGENVKAALEEGHSAFHCPQGLTREWFASTPELQQLLDVFVDCDV